MSSMHIGEEIVERRELRPSRIAILKSRQRTRHTLRNERLTIPEYG